MVERRNGCSREGLERRGIRLSVMNEMLKAGGSGDNSDECKSESPNAMQACVMQLYGGCARSAASWTSPWYNGLGGVQASRHGLSYFHLRAIHSDAALRFSAIANIPFTQVLVNSASIVYIATVDH